MRLYLIGAGVIARTHATAAGKLGEPVELRVADPNAQVLADFVAAFPGARSFPSADEMLAAEPAADEDVVVVATPPFAHLEPALAAFRSGRHVLVEKPLAMTVDEAEQLLAAAEAAGRVLGSCSTRFRGLPHTEAVKAVLASGDLGDVYALEFSTRWPRSRAGIEYQPSSRWFLDRSKSGGGVLMDWGPYDMATLFDLLHPARVEVRDAWLAQPVTGADPADAVFDVETDVGAALRVTLDDGRSLPVRFARASGTHGEEEARAQFLGTRGALVWTPFDSRAPVRLRVDDGAGSVVEREVPPPPREDLEIFDRPLVEFVAALRGRPSRASLGAECVDEFRCLDAIAECARTGQPQVVAVRR